MVYFVADKDEWYQSGVRWMHEKFNVLSCWEEFGG